MYALSMKPVSLELDVKDKESWRSNLELISICLLILSNIVVWVVCRTGPHELSLILKYGKIQYYYRYK